VNDGERLAFGVGLGDAGTPVRPAGPELDAAHISVDGAEAGLRERGQRQIARLRREAAASWGSSRNWSDWPADPVGSAGLNQTRARLGGEATAPAAHGPGDAQSLAGSVRGRLVRASRRRDDPAGQLFPRPLLSCERMGRQSSGPGR